MEKRLILQWFATHEAKAQPFRVADAFLGFRGYQLKNIVGNIQHGRFFPFMILLPVIISDLRLWPLAPILRPNISLGRQHFPSEHSGTIWEQHTSLFAIVHKAIPIFFVVQIDTIFVPIKHNRGPLIQCFFHKKRKVLCRSYPAQNIYHIFNMAPKSGFISVQAPILSSFARIPCKV